MKVTRRVAAAKPKRKPRRRQARAAVAQPGALVRASSRQIRQNGSRPCSITHREMVLDVQGTSPSEFKRDFICNPRKALGSAVWLVPIAKDYEMYRYTSLEFEYIPSCPTSTPGNICMFLDYDPLDDNRGISYGQASMMADAVASQCWQETRLRYRANLTVLAQHKYFCSESVSPDRLNDCCRLWLVTSSPTDAVMFGKLYVNYTVEFFNPEVPSAAAPQSGSVQVRKSKVATATASFVAPVCDKLDIGGDEIEAFVANLPNDWRRTLEASITRYLINSVTKAVFPTVIPDLDRRHYGLVHTVTQGIQDLSADVSDTYVNAQPHGAITYIYNTTAPDVVCDVNIAGDYTPVGGGPGLDYLVLQFQFSNGWHTSTPPNSNVWVYEPSQYAMGGPATHTWISGTMHFTRDLNDTNTLFWISFWFVDNGFGANWAFDGTISAANEVMCIDAPGYQNVD